MLEQVLKEIYGVMYYNWPIVAGGIHNGTFEVRDGGIELPFLANGQYFKVFGSVFNDGLWQYPAAEMTEETFCGTVWALAIPKGVISLVEEIEAWEAKYGAAAAGVFQSESKADYSYTKATDNTTGGAVTWKTAFRSQLNQWRKI